MGGYPEGGNRAESGRILRRQTRGCTRSIRLLVARGEDVLVRGASTASQEPGLESEFVFPLDLPPARLTGSHRAWI